MVRLISFISFTKLQTYLFLQTLIFTFCAWKKISKWWIFLSVSLLSLGNWNMWFLQWFMGKSSKNKIHARITRLTVLGERRVDLRTSAFIMSNWKGITSIYLYMNLNGKFLLIIQIRQPQRDISMGNYWQLKFLKIYQYFLSYDGNKYPEFVSYNTGITWHTQTMLVAYLFTSVSFNPSTEFWLQRRQSERMYNLDCK